MTMKNLSIGVFDSGVGGLTVLKEVRALLPGERIIYLGDTARVPYGNRSPATVTKYSFENALFLLTKGIKMLVIACNTSSALSMGFIKRRLPVPVVGVINAAAREAASKTAKGRIGVIGTKGTIKSGAYERAMNRINPELTVITRSCPLFVPIVEEGMEHDRIAYLAAHQYLSDLKSARIDVLVMGCTHYPMLEPVIQKVMGKQVDVVNTGKATAREVRAVLERRSLLRSGRDGTTEYYVTDGPAAFAEIGGRILGESLGRVRCLKGAGFKEPVPFL